MIETIDRLSEAWSELWDAVLDNSVTTGPAAAAFRLAEHLAPRLDAQEVLGERPWDTDGGRA